MWIGDDIKDLDALPGPLHLAIGVFDGVHRGHQAVIHSALDRVCHAPGIPVVLTFDPHPRTLLRPHEAPQLLTCTNQKLLLFRRLGIAHVLVVRFDAALAALTAEEFVEALVTHAKPLGSVAVGQEWCFGRGRGGTVALLKQLGPRFGFEVCGVDPVYHQGEVISSTRIRKAIAMGDLAQAEMLLGRPFAVTGTVVQGSGRGREWGFPTANISPQNGLLPPDGVYVATIEIGEMGEHRAVLNLGTRPTVEAGAARVLEVHVLDLNADLYGRWVGVSFLAKLRDEERFPSITALQRQIAQDIADARSWRNLNERDCGRASLGLETQARRGGLP